MASPLEDLDELTLRCRDQKARLYIAEAVSSYRSGAFRSAIVATWIAVCFDVIEKLRELALAGDKEAERHVQDLDTTRRTGDLTRALKFERELLDLAKDKFDLLSPLEYIDLDRLQADRNRCAHPSLTSDDQAYSPSAELARLHLHSAVTHLLQHPPVQGKYALDRLLNEINSDYFPSSPKEARVAFASGPLRRPRDSLLRNLTIVLAKTLLHEKPDYKRRNRIAAALAALRDMHPSPVASALADRLSSLFRPISDQDLSWATTFLEHVPDTWQFLEPDVCQRLQHYVRDLPAANFEDLDFLLKFVPLQIQARARTARATKKELNEALFFDLPKEVADRYIAIYLGASTFDDANAWAKSMIPVVGDFSSDQVRQLLVGAAKNTQVSGSFQLGSVVTALRSKKKLPIEEFEELLRSNGLAEFTLPPE
jgi:hypothetical protein